MQDKSGAAQDIFEATNHVCVCDQTKKTWQGTFCVDLSAQNEKPVGRDKYHFALRGKKKHLKALSAFFFLFTVLKLSLIRLKIALLHYLKHHSGCLFLSDGNISGTHTG